MISHDWVNEEYKHLVVAASAKALAVKPGQFFNLLCPSPDAGELWLRRPQSVYRIDRAQGRIEFLYKCVGRGTRGLATVAARRQAQHRRPARRRFSSRSGLGATSSCSAAASGSRRSAPISQLAGENGVGVTAILSARSPELVMAADLFGSVGTVIPVLDSDGSSDVGNVEKHPARG